MEAMDRQVRKLDYVHPGFFSAEPAEHLADLLMEDAPAGISHVYFVSGGSEAMEAALKMARQYFLEIGQPKRSKFISRRQSYHGNTLGALSVGGNLARREPYAPMLMDVSLIAPCFAYHFKRDDETEEQYGRRVADELEAPVGKEFRLLYDWQNFGMSLPVALQRFADRSPVLDARFFATSVLVQRESGGNLAELLDDLSRVIRERFRVKRQIQVLSAHGRMTGMVLSGMPIALAAYFFITRPEYLSELLTNPMGQKMLIGAAMMQILGTYLISRIVDIEY